MTKMISPGSVLMFACLREMKEWIIIPIEQVDASEKEIRFPKNNPESKMVLL